MKYFVVEPFTLETSQGKVTLPAGKILELSQEQAARLAGKVFLADELYLWRWFVLEADRVYRTAPKAADSWKRHNEHKKAADDLCRAGNIAAAKAELEKALEALQGAAMTQQGLIA